MAKEIVKNAKVLFFSPEDQGFGTSITIEVTEPIYQQLSAFYEKNNVGNPNKTEVGKLNIKEYEGTYQFSLKVNAHTKYAGLNGLTVSDIGFGSTIDLLINTFEYNNKFTKGNTYVGVSVSAVLVLSACKSGGTDDLNVLMQAYEG